MTTKKTPVPDDFNAKLLEVARRNATSFSVRFNPSGDELGWVVPADDYDTEGHKYFGTMTAYYVKYDINGQPYEIKSVNGYDCTEEALLLSINRTNAVQPAQSPEDPRDKVKPDIWAITKGFCR